MAVVGCFLRPVTWNDHIALVKNRRIWARIGTWCEVGIVPEEPVFYGYVLHASVAGPTDRHIVVGIVNLCPDAPEVMCNMIGDFPGHAIPIPVLNEDLIA